MSSRLNADWPGTHRYGYVLADAVGATGDPIPCAIWAVCSVPNRALTFHVLLENGACYARVPLQQLRHTLTDLPALPLHALEAWDCFGYDLTVQAHGYLRERDVEVRLGDGYGSLMGRYCCTVDWVDNGYSDTPDQHKQAHLIALENGQFAAMPNNRLRWHDASFTDWTRPITLKTNTTVHYAETPLIVSPHHGSYAE